MGALKLLDLQKLVNELDPSLSRGLRSRKPSASPSLEPDRSLSLTRSIADFEDAISFLSPDVPRGNGSTFDSCGQPLEGYWLGVVWAARRAFGSDGEALVRKWSEGSDRYSAEGFDEAWGSFDPDHPTPVTVSSVFALARKKGWSGALTAKPLPVPQPKRFKLLDRAAIMAIPPLQWRVKGLFPTTGIGAIYGASTAGKSFLALDLAMNIVRGQAWFGCRTLACPVTYVMLEGEGGLRGRILAWELHNRAELPGDFRAITQGFDIANDNDVEDLGAALPHGSVVMIDTLNRAAPGLDENSSKDMGLVLKGMKRLQEISSGLAIAIHHVGKDASRGMRGHSSLSAALDGAMEVSRDGAVRSWSAAKVKDGGDGGCKPFKLHIIPLGTDTDGEPIESCAISCDENAVFAVKPPSGHAQRAALKHLLVELSVSTVSAKAGAPGQCLELDEAIKTLAATLATVEMKRRRNRARTLIGSLCDGVHLRSAIDEQGTTWLWK